LFYAFPPEGLDLYDEQGKPVTGNFTDQLFLYDAGTEEDTAPGTGPDQKPAQDPSAVNQGADEDENVTLVSQAESNDFDYPDTEDVIQVSVEHDGDTEFTVTVTNVSQPGSIDSERAGGSVPLSPGAWVVYENALTFRLYQNNEPASQGIELIAEDGFPADMIDNDNIDTPVDAGTEVDQEPGVGLNQKPRQEPTEEDKGPDEGGVVESVVAAGEDSGTDGDFSYLGASQVIRITITPQTQTGN
jgi:hypothetical protein